MIRQDIETKALNEGHIARQERVKKADPYVRSDIILFGSFSAPQKLETNGVVVVEENITKQIRLHILIHFH